ncbi:MAG: succinylglutamate desuccinylase/aspartoacylase family protein [Betaproteobacteria bacterium]|nr:succinylglutamate desuccinylase/aspartoacylase family protein [Betaproteobacteria bacterium]
MTTDTSIRIELTPPDIRRWQDGNTGIEYVHTFEGRAPGPHVMVNAITHGNELCGAITVDRLLDMTRAGLRPARGKLTLSFANIRAYENWNPDTPHANRFVDEDFNRVWTAEALDGPRQSVELTRARAMRPAVEAVDLLFDIHSMHNPHGPVMICGPLKKGIDLARAVSIPEYIVSDKGHANGTRLRDFAGFGDPESPKNALLVECGQHWEAAAAEVSWQSTWRFLKVSGVMDATICDREIVDASAPPQKVVKVSDAIIANTTDFRFAEGLTGLSVVKTKGDLIGTDGDQPVTAPYDDCVLIMPTMTHVKPGLTVVRIGRFV